MKSQVVIILCLGASGLALENYHKRETNSRTTLIKDIDCHDGLKNDYKGTLTHIGNFLSNIHDNSYIILYVMSKRSCIKMLNIINQLDAVRDMLIESYEGDVDSIKSSENNEKLLMLFQNVISKIELLRGPFEFITPWYCAVSWGPVGTKFEKILNNFNVADPKNNTQQLKTLIYQLWQTAELPLAKPSDEIEK